MKNPNFSYSCSFFPLKIKITTYLKILKNMQREILIYLILLSLHIQFIKKRKAKLEVLKSKGFR